MALTISEVAHLSGLSVHTLRYYDELGLLPQVKRAKNGHRMFDEDVVGWIHIIKCLRATRMSLSDIQRFTYLAHQDMDTIAQQRELLETHRRQVEERMREVEAAIALIDDKIQQSARNRTKLTPPSYLMRLIRPFENTHRFELSHWNELCSIKN